MNLIRRIEAMEQAAQTLNPPPSDDSWIEGILLKDVPEEDREPWARTYGKLADNLPLNAEESIMFGRYSLKILEIGDDARSQLEAAGFDVAGRKRKR